MNPRVNTLLGADCPITIYSVNLLRGRGLNTIPINFNSLTPELLIRPSFMIQNSIEVQKHVVILSDRDESLQFLKRSIFCWYCGLLVKFTEVP